MLFKEGGLTEALEEMKADWVSGVREHQRRFTPWGILYNLSNLDRLSFSWDQATVLTNINKWTKGSKRYISVLVPTQTFFIGLHQGYITGMEIQHYKAQAPMKDLICTDASILCPFTGADSEVTDQSILFLDYVLRDPPSSLEEVPVYVEALKEMIAHDREAIEHNTRVLANEVRAWVKKNLSEVNDLVEEEKWKDQTDPLEAVVSSLAREMNIIRAKSIYHD